jgi:hypothetical protein
MRLMVSFSLLLALVGPSSAQSKTADLAPKYLPAQVLAEHGYCCRSARVGVAILPAVHRRANKLPMNQQAEPLSPQPGLLKAIAGQRSAIRPATPQAAQPEGAATSRDRDDDVARAERRDHRKRALRGSRASGPAAVKSAVAHRSTEGADYSRAVAADPAKLCETAAATAEFVNRLPPRLLSAISLTETGRIDRASGRVRPWPWTINAEGVGQFFDTRAQAVAAARVLQARGVQSIDAGCLQVNLMYHPEAFGSLDDAFDPQANASYAARFLNTLFAAGRPWTQAIAAYHSETPALGDAYRVLVLARWRSGDLLTGDPIRTAYRDMGGGDAVYGAFAPRSRVYRAFRQPANER